MCNPAVLLSHRPAITASREIFLKHYSIRAERQEAKYFSFFLRIGVLIPSNCYENTYWTVQLRGCLPYEQTNTRAYNTHDIPPQGLASAGDEPRTSHPRPLSVTSNIRRLITTLVKGEKGETR